MAEILSGDDIRNIINNAHKIKKFNRCTVCKGSGGVNWNGETGRDLKPGYLTSYDGVRDDGECEKCDGVGYVDFLMYDD